LPSFILLYLPRFRHALAGRSMPIFARNATFARRLRDMSFQLCVSLRLKGAARPANTENFAQ
jgi:hypothetical protein